MSPRASLARQEPTAGEDWATLARWIEGFLSTKPLTSPRRVVEWQTWAREKLVGGWTPMSVRDHIVGAWKRWVAHGNADTSPLPAALALALKDVYEMAEHGADPKTCAVVYRSLAKEYPQRVWLADAAERMERAETWADVEDLP